ncbi:MAG: hypothetical protein KAR33_06745 [Candidatus Thorarchaeota archaeon]|nr:hypothetical protein [Candidatus Thorarchaeota archaeon]
MSPGRSPDEIGKWVVITAYNMLAFAELMIVGWTTTYPHMQDDVLFTSFSWILLFTGLFLLVVGVFLLGLGSKSVSEEYSVLEIAAMRKKVTIAELQRETNLPREAIERILRDALLNQRLSGYLEDDEFVRDVSVSPWKSDMA